VELHVILLTIVRSRAAWKLCHRHVIRQRFRGATTGSVTVEMFNGRSNDLQCPFNEIAAVQVGAARQ